MTKNLVSAIFQIIFDIAAVAVFFDLVDQFEKLFIGQKWLQKKHWATKFRSSIRKYKTSKDMSTLIKAIPIFDGIPDEAFNQMLLSSKIMSFKPGTRICKDGDHSTELYVVIEGQVGIFKKQENGKSQKALDINEGSIFGEGGFLLARPRLGSAYCLTKTLLLVIKRPKAFTSSDLTQELSLSQFQKKIWAFQALSQSEFFKDLPSEAVMQLITEGEIIEMPPQAGVIKQGEMSDSLWVIIQGKCQVIIDEEKIREMNSKDVFGEIGIIWNIPRTSSVTTSAQTIFLRIHAKHVWTLLSHNLNIAVALQVLGEKRLLTAQAR